MPTALHDERVSTTIGKQQVWRGGRGPHLLYLHSATGEAAGQPALEELADDFTVVAPLFPGFGESEGIDQVDGPEDAAFHLLDLVETMALERPLVVGTSLGGWLAFELACRWPERLSRLVAVNPVGLFVAGAPIKEIFGRDPGDLADDLFADRSHPMAQAAHQFGAASRRPGGIPFELVKPLLQSLAATARIAWNPYLHNPKLPGRLHRVTNPTLVVRGGADRLVPAAHADRYVELLPDARLVEVDGAGHLLTLERPADLAALVRRFAVGDSG